MLVSDHARMLAVAPGGWDRCLCRHCRPYHPGTKSARTIERRLLAADIADAMDDARDDDGPFIHIVPAEGACGTAEDAEDYTRLRAIEDAREIIADALDALYSRPEDYCCFDCYTPNGEALSDWLLRTHDC